MSVTVATVMKKVALLVIRNPKVLKIISGIVLGIVIIIIMPIIAVVSIFDSGLQIDTGRWREELVANLTAEEQAKLQFIEDTMLAIEEEMTNAGMGDRAQEAQVLYVLALSDCAEDPDFVSKLTGCFVPRQTDEELIAAVNATFEKGVIVEEFTKTMEWIEREATEEEVSICEK